MDDQDINQILIVTQKPRRILSKHPQGDRLSGSHQSRNKMTADLAQAINDGLYYYEQVRYFSCNCVTLSMIRRTCYLNIRIPVMFQGAKKWLHTAKLD